MTERDFVIGVLKGVADWFQENPHEIANARNMWQEDGDSIRILGMMIEGRCKEKAADGETSRLEPFNDEDGAMRLRKLIKSFDDDPEVSAYLSQMEGSNGK
jgi:hypothetical protein